MVFRADGFLGFNARCHVVAAPQADALLPRDLCAYGTLDRFHAPASRPEQRFDRADSGQSPALDAVLLGTEPLRHAGAAAGLAVPASARQFAGPGLPDDLRRTGGDRLAGALLRALAGMVCRGVPELLGFSG